MHFPEIAPGASEPPKPEFGPVPRLLDVATTRSLLPRIHAFENVMFGVEFACEWSQIERWYRSADYVVAAIASATECNDLVIHAVGSLLLTSSKSMNQLQEGELQDYELEPWSQQSGAVGEPTIYFASIFADSRKNLIAIYDAMGERIATRLNSLGVEVYEAFSIAGGRQGWKHLVKSGFLPNGQLYRGKYQILTVQQSTAITPPWKSLLKARGSRLTTGDHRLSSNPPGVHETKQFRLRLGA